MPNSQFPIPDAQFPIPDARCPIPDARCPIPDARGPIPNSLMLVSGLKVFKDSLKRVHQPVDIVCGSRKNVEFPFFASGS